MGAVVVVETRCRSRFRGTSRSRYVRNLRNSVPRWRGTHVPITLPCGFRILKRRTSRARGACSRASLALKPNQMRGAIEGLNLALFIEAEHQRPIGRMEVQPDDVTHLRNRGSFEILNFSTRRLDIAPSRATRGPDARYGQVLGLSSALPSAGRVFSVVSRIFCSNAAVRTRRDRVGALRLHGGARIAKAARTARIVGRVSPVCNRMIDTPSLASNVAFPGRAPRARAPPTRASASPRLPAPRHVRTCPHQMK